MSHICANSRAPAKQTLDHGDHGLAAIPDGIGKIAVASKALAPLRQRALRHFCRLLDVIARGECPPATTRDDNHPDVRIVVGLLDRLSDFPLQGKAEGI